jgi:uncharacterized protein YjbJ (UPF0337 family)
MHMDFDRMSGIGHQIKGVVKESLGKMLGDSKLFAEGVAEREAGKVQNAGGIVRDAARNAHDE